MWHDKAKPKSVAYRSNHKPDEVPEACIAEVDKRDESRGTMELADKPKMSLTGRTDGAHIN